MEEKQGRGVPDWLPGGSALRNQVDLLPADIAIRVQLTATDYEKAVSWYQAINERPERDGSALQGHVVPLYPQGSMAICIDIVAKTRAAARLDPERVLDLLFDTTRGEPDSRYSAMSDRDRA